MPISCPLAFGAVTDADFKEIDRAVMGCAYASQNALGRLCEERVYENDVAARLKAEGYTAVQTQVPVTVVHDFFRKTYRLDLVVNQMIYELKASNGFTPENETQAIHYAALLATNRIKLLNFGTEKVMGKLIGTPFAQINRLQVRYDESRWQVLSDGCERLKQWMVVLLADWGAFLEAPLYAEALIAFHGGEEACLRRVPIHRNGLELGTQPMPCHANQMAFAVTALTQNVVAYERHLRRLLSFTPLRGMQWMNLNHAQLELITLQNGKGMKAEE